MLELSYISTLRGINLKFYNKSPTAKPRAPKVTPPALIFSAAFELVAAAAASEVGVAVEPLAVLPASEVLVAVVPVVAFAGEYPIAVPARLVVVVAASVATSDGVPVPVWTTPLGDV